ncbi:MAG: hypothetical protein Q9160_000568 [Pyrenula sp. 1 TL-2023]
MSGLSSVGNSGVYEAGDQRNAPRDEINDAARYHEGKQHSHFANDSKDERTIANKLAREEQRQKESDETGSVEEALSKKDATLPAKAHGNEPSKGAKIDQELAEEEEEMLKKKDKKKGKN